MACCKNESNKNHVLQSHMETTVIPGPYQGPGLSSDINMSYQFGDSSPISHRTNIENTSHVSPNHGQSNTNRG